MITVAAFRNFRTLRAVQIRFEPLTALVGPNACGKSSVLEGLHPDHPLRDDDLSNGARDPCEITITYDGGVLRRTVPNRGTSVRQASYDYEIYQLELAALRNPNTVSQSDRLSRTGENLTNCFATLGRAGQQRAVSAFTQLVPAFSDVDARPLAQGQHRLVFQDRWNPTKWYEPSQVSDGSMLSLALVVLHHQAKPVDVVAIEEPERGLHPWLVGKVVELLRSMSTGELGGRTTQVILATQSADLLNHLQPSEVRFFSRDSATGDVEVREAPTQSKDWERVLGEYEHSMGSMWLAGGLGGVPPG